MHLNISRGTLYSGHTLPYMGMSQKRPSGRTRPRAISPSAPPPHGGGYPAPPRGPAPLQSSLKATFIISEFYPCIPYPDWQGLAVSAAAAAAATAVADAALVAAAVAADTAFFIPVTYIFNVIILKSFYIYIIVLTFSFFS